MKTLSNTINALFQKTLEEKELTTLIAQLKNKKYITINNENITYTLPETAP
ncbi:hypothetical protein P3T73_15215 [Kiritimatiellota bacterium B12222]|nr:hypothetical protein P3T73_15215 [Kiritimatiellota bacterium B12222]